MIRRIYNPLLVWIVLHSRAVSALTLASTSRGNVPWTRRTPYYQGSSLSTALSSSSDNYDDKIPDMADVGIVLLAGGKGSRMKANMPKQFLELAGVPILHHSLELFLERLPTYLKQRGLQGPPHLVLVLDPMYQAEYQPLLDRYPNNTVTFANPGVERQGSVENGLAQLMASSNSVCQYVAIHDSARPLVTIQEVCHVVHDAKTTAAAAVLGVPCKATIKLTKDGGKTVTETIPRAQLWEAHTPQVIKIDVLERGFAQVRRDNLDVTDDVSVVEGLGDVPVLLTLGEYTNLKITTPEDLSVADSIVRQRGYRPINMLQSSSSLAKTKTKKSQQAPQDFAALVGLVDIPRRKPYVAIDDCFFLRADTTSPRSYAPVVRTFHELGQSEK